MHDTDAVTRLLKQLLAIHQPELGARLKQRLLAAFVRDGLGVFDEKSYGYKRFKDYLKNKHGDVVTIEPLEGQDILVSLRHGLQPSAPNPVNDSVAIRGEVWMAFANPDTNRKRFFDRETGAVIHFLIDHMTPAQAEIQRKPGRYVEIIPIAGDLQDQWMQKFLENMPIDSATRDALAPLVRETYSTAANAAFTRALGTHGFEWRRYRTAQIIQHIKNWSNESSVSMGLLVVPTKYEKPVVKETSSPAHNPSPKENAIKILDLLSDEDIRDIVNPILVSTFLIKQRR